MATKTAILAVRIVTDAKGATANLDRYTGGLGRMETGLTRLRVPAAIALGAITALAVKSGQAASELEQATGAVEAVFGAAAGETKKLAQQAAENVGLAASEYSNLAAVLGSQLKNMGVPLDNLVGQTDELIRLGADLAATYGGTTADAVAALSSLLRGERDPIERYGVTIKDATLEAKKAELGLAGLTGAADTNADAQAALALLYEQTAAAAGQYGEESDTAAHAQQEATAKMKDAEAAMGTALLPIIILVADALSDLAAWIQENTLAFQIIIGIILTAAAAVWILNFAMLANPIGLIIAGVAALIAIIIVIISEWETLERVFGDVMESMANWWNDLVEGFAYGFDQIVGWIEDLIGWFEDLINIQGATSVTPATVAGYRFPAGAGVTAYQSSSGAPFMFPRARAVPAPPAGVNITIQGAIDPDSTARQIRRVMNTYSRKTGLTPAGGSSWH